MRDRTPELQRTPDVELEGYDLPEIFKACEDPPFDRYVDVHLIGMAIHDDDAGLMTDAALQTAEGERVLHRPRRGLPADTLLLVAAKMAAQNRDRPALRCLARAAAHQPAKEWARQVDSAQKLMGGSREGDPRCALAVDAVTPEQFQIVRAWSLGFSQAVALGDAEHLAVLGEVIPLLDGLDQQQRDHLRAEVDRGGKEIRTKLNGVGNEQKILKALAGATRGWGVNLPKVNISPDPILPTNPIPPALDRAGQWWTKKVRDPVVQAENAPQKALDKGQQKYNDATARIPIPYTGSDLDYIQVSGGKVIKNPPILTVRAPNGGWVGQSLYFLYKGRRVRATFAFQVIKGQARILIAKQGTTGYVALETVYAGPWRQAGYEGKSYVEVNLPAGNDTYYALLRLTSGSTVNVLGLVTQGK
jgi:hypothetical protein